MKIEEYVPTITPTIKANAKFLITSPANKNNITTTINVVKEVMTVLLNESFKDLFTIQSKFFFGNFAWVSRILSNITIVSFKEYPTIVKKAAIIVKSISMFKIEKIPRVIKISWVKAERLP